MCRPSMRNLKLMSEARQTKLLAHRVAGQLIKQRTLLPLIQFQPVIQQYLKSPNRLARPILTPGERN